MSDERAKRSDAASASAFGPDAETERLITAAELATFGIWDWDLRTDALYWSPAQMELLGVRPEDFVPHASTFFDSLHPDDRAPVQEALRRHLEEGRPYDVTMRVAHAEGHYLTQRVRGRAFRDESGEPHRICGVVTDVTHEQAVLQALEDSERRFRDMAANVPGAIFRYALYPDGRDEIGYMSPGCFDLWEYDAETLQGDPTLLWQAIHQSDLPAMQKSVMRSAHTLEPWSHRWRIRTPSGVEKWVHGRGLPRRLPNGTVIWNTLILDVTDQIRTEQQLYESRELLHHAQKMEALGQLTGGLAHDFNNLLSVVTSGLELLAGDDNLAPEQRDTVREMLDATGRGAQLTRTLLSFARRSELSPENVDLDTVTQEMCALAKRTLPANVVVRILTHSEARARVDRALLENAFLNLLLNARDALPRGGTVTVSVGVERSFEHPALGFGNYAWCRVEDDGVGMPESVRQRVFEPFFTTKTHGGTGLGLSMVHGFVTQSGGTVVVESEEGRGSRVTLWLPLSEGPADPRRAEDERESATTLAAARVLFVEDDRAVRRALSRVLRRRGYEVVEVDDAEAALARLENESFDLVLSDVQMPGEIQGDGLAQEVADRYGLPVILLSGNPPEARRPDRATYLVKPIRGRALADAIASRLDEA